MGMGHPVIGARSSTACGRASRATSMSSNSGDMFSPDADRPSVRALHATTTPCQRAQPMPDTLDLTCATRSRWGTANGAEAPGLEDRIGSLTPGKQADVIVIGGDRLNMCRWPTRSGCLVAQANASNVRHVLVAGAFVEARRGARGSGRGSRRAARARGVGTGARDGPRGRRASARPLPRGSPTC